jgi:vancomycin resistance protein YoaR
MPERYITEYSPIRRRERGETPEIPTDASLDPTRVVGKGIASASDDGITNEIETSHTPVAYIIVALVVLALITPYILPQSQPTVANGTTLQGQAVAGLSRGMLDARVPELYADFLRNPVTLMFRDQSWQPTSAELGISLDIKRTNNALLGLSLAPNQGAISWVSTLWRRWQGALDVGPHIVINAPQLQSYLIGLATTIDRPARPANILIDPQSGTSQVVEAENGRQLLVDETIFDIIQATKSVTPATVAIRTREITPAGDAQRIMESAAAAERFLSAPLTIRAGDQVWEWGKDEIIYLFTVEQRPDGVAVTPNAGAIALEVERLAKRIDRPSQEPRVRLVDGVPTLLAAGVPGVVVDQAATVAAIRDAFYATNRVVEVPTQAVAPQLSDSDISALRFDDILSTGRSRFQGSAPYRITNIQAGVARINGVLIPPQTEFSFNTTIGTIDEANGFVQGYAVVDNRTQLEWGGGICQVSTSLFRAAFYAGLTITEWHPHPFYISWYDADAFPTGDGPGLDAAIFTGEDDFKFVNDTEHWMMIDATMDEAQRILDIQLRGVATNREVRVTGPIVVDTIPAPSDPKYVDDPTLPQGVVKQSDKARDGMNIVVYREIIRDGKADPSEEFATSFAPWPNIYLRGTGGQNGTTPAP